MNNWIQNSNENLCYNTISIGSQTQALIWYVSLLKLSITCSQEESVLMGEKKERHSNVLFISSPISEMTFVSSFILETYKLREFVHNTQKDITEIS